MLYWVPNHFSLRSHWPSLAADSKTRLALWGLSWLRASAMIYKFQTIFQFKCSSGCLTQQTLLSWNAGRTSHNKLTKQICFLNTTSVSINTKPVPALCLITNAFTHACITQYAHVFLTSKHIIRVQRTFTSGLYSNKSWSPVRKSSFWNNCMFSQRFST